MSTRWRSQLPASGFSAHFIHAFSVVIFGNCAGSFSQFFPASHAKDADMTERRAARERFCFSSFFFLLSTLSSQPSTFSFMRIIRHLSSSGPVYAALQSDGSAREITGDIYGDFRVTDRAVKPGKLLAPIDPIYLPCSGLNYKRHAAESNNPPPPH